MFVKRLMRCSATPNRNVKLSTMNSQSSSGLKLGVIALSSLLLTANDVSSQQQPGKLTFESYLFESATKQKLQAELGRLLVPERNSKPGGSQIELALVRFKSTATNPGPPIVYLAGGPGGSGIALARGPRFPLFMAMREVADVIALDQRGTGRSKPNLICDVTLDYPLDQPGERGRLLSLYEQRARICAEHWRAEGVDLSAYNTEESADDLESLRQALGVERITLWGSSYGSHLGLAALRRHGNRIHRAILSGIEGPDHTLKLPNQIQSQLQLVSELAKEDSSSNKRIPDLMALVQDVLRKLDQEPAKVPLNDATTGKTKIVAIGKFDLQQITFGLLGTREGKTRIPALYQSLAVGDFSSPAVQSAARELVAMRTGSIGSAMAFAMDCASGASAERRARIQREASATLLGGDVDFPVPDICPAWQLPELPASFRAPLRSTVPTLFISGTFDGRTPPANAEEIMKGFPNAQHVIIEGAGHGNELFISSPQIQEVMLEFMKTGTVSRHTIRLPPFELKPIPSAKNKN